MKKYIALLLVLVLLSGCQAPAESVSGPEKAEKTVYAMDTIMTLTAYGSQREAALDAARDEIWRLDSLLSITEPGSDIYKISPQHETSGVSLETAKLLQRALDIAELTDGDYDPTMGMLMVLWGFLNDQPHVPDADSIAEWLGSVGFEKLTVVSEPAEDGGEATVVNGAGCSVDLGGIAKGYTSEQALAAMAQAGVDSAIISLGGNVGTLGRKPDGSAWTVAIQDPENQESYIATLSLGEEDGCVYAITSGGYQRYLEEDGKRYHHILDPKTGTPAETDLLSVTIVSADGTLADGLSTALFVKGFEEAVEFWRANAGEFEMVLVTEDGLFATEGLEIASERPVNILEVTP